MFILTAADYRPGAYGDVASVTLDTLDACHALARELNCAIYSTDDGTTVTVWEADDAAIYAVEVRETTPLDDNGEFTATPAEIEAIDAALDRAEQLGVSVTADAYEVADQLAALSRDDDVDVERVEVGRLNGSTWYVGLTLDHTEPGSPYVAYLEQSEPVDLSTEDAARFVSHGVRVRYANGSWRTTSAYAETFPVADD